MRYKPVNLIGGFNTDESVPWAVEDTVNFIPEKASSEGNRTPAKLRGAPGLRPYAQIGPNPIRGMHNAEGKLFVVSGTKLYQIRNTGIAIPLGTVPGVQRVTMAHNQIVGGNQIIVNTGTPNGYVYSTVTQIFGKITDPGYPGGGSVDYIDTYLVQVEPFGRYFFWSAQADALNYNTLDRAEAEASPDGIVGLAVNNFEVIIFGKSTVEFFYNAGTTTGTFKSKRVWIEHGCAGRDTIASMDNTLYWLSPERILYRLNGYSAEPVSTPQFEEAIAGYDYANAFAFVYEDQGHKIYYLTFPDGKTFGFDVTTGLMHRRESYGLKRWRLNALANWNRGWYGGDFQSGKLYKVDWDYMLEGESTELVSTRTTGMLSLNQNRITIPYVEVLVDSGQPETIGVAFPIQPEPPTITGDAPDAIIGDTYNPYQYTIGGGTGELVVTLVSGSLPVGFTISTSGLLSGTASVYATYVFTLRVTDINGLWDEVTDTMRSWYGLPTLFAGSYSFNGPSNALIEGALLPYTIATASKTMSASLKGNYVSVGGGTSPYMQVMKKVGSSYTLLPTISGLDARPANGTDFSPDGNWLVVTTANGAAGEIRLFSRSGDTFTLTDTVTGSEGGMVRFSPDGTRVAWVQREYGPYYGISIYTLDTNTGTLVGRRNGAAASYSGGASLSWDTFNRFIVIGGSSKLNIFDTSGSGSVPIVSSPDITGYPNGSSGAHWSPSGTFIYTVSPSKVGGIAVSSYSFNRTTFATNRLSAPTQPPGTIFYDSSVTSDGMTLAIAQSGDTGEHSVSLYDLSDGNMTVISPPTTTQSNSFVIAWSKIPQN